MPSFYPEVQIQRQQSGANLASKVNLYVSPWIRGTRAVAYFGKLEITMKKYKSWEHCFNVLVNRARRKVVREGGNSLVGVELAIDPFLIPPVIYLSGTVATLERWP